MPTLQHLKLFCLLLLTLVASEIHAQSKVFKELAGDMSTQFETIRQDGNLVGYLVFSQLEKSSADSFHYRIAIMDENLNDIGKVDFNEEKLFLKAVAFEQDVLCLAYIKSNFVGEEFRNERQFRRGTADARSALFTQFVSLKGKIIGSHSTSMDIKPDAQLAYNSFHKVIGNGRVKQPIQLRNIAGKGFACFFGDDSKNDLLILNPNGTLAWQKIIKEDAENFMLLTSGKEVSLLMKKKEAMVEGGFELLSYNSVDSTVYPKFIIKDKKGNSLKVLAFDNDPVSGKPYLSGLVIDPRKGNDLINGKSISRGPYSGIFTINLNGHRRQDIQASFSYWADGSQSFVDKYGYFTNPRSYALLESSFKDYEGNTWFTGAGLIRKTRWGIVTASVITAPTVFIPIYLLIWGTQKCALTDVLMVKQDNKGVMTLANSIPTFHPHSVQAKTPLSEYNNVSFYPVSNSDTHNSYLVTDDQKNIYIYNVGQNRLTRTIPHQSGNSTFAFFPAKEGYVMISEYNRKEKYTRVSIEAL